MIQAHALCHHRSMAFQQPLEKAQAGSGWGPCQGHCMGRMPGYCRPWGGWKLQGRDSKTSRFCHSFSGARFLIYGFCHEISSPEFCSESWVAFCNADAVGADNAQSTFQPQAWELCLSLPRENVSLVTSHIVASTLFVFCKLNVRRFLF